MASKKTAKPKTKQATSNLLKDVEKLGEALAEDTKLVFDDLSVKVSNTAKSAAEDISEKTSSLRETISEKTAAVTDDIVERTSSVADKVAQTELGRHFKDIIDQIEETGESLFNAVSKRIDTLRGKVATSSKTAPKTKLKKKKTSKAKATKKKAAKKKATKKNAAKKKVSKKKIAASKKS